MSQSTSKANRSALLKSLAKYEKPSLGRALWQLTNTFIPYVFLWFLMVRTVQLGYSYWITLALAVVAAGLMVRLFIFFHDCCHCSFFASQRANTLVGYVTGILTFTPYLNWRYSHSVHHAHAGDLDRRGVGDIWTMTVDEYLAASRWQRVLYRLVRNPLITFGVGPAFIFLVANRLPSANRKMRHHVSVLLTDLAILAIVVGVSLLVGFKTYLLVQLPIIFIGGAAGVWLFYIQHQYQGVYWARHDVWDPIKAALEGSSFYKLPKVLQWFTGNIGFHHIHHLRARIPNYNLQQSYDEVPAVQAVKPLGVRESLKSMWLDLWDEERQCLISFRELKALPQVG